MGFLAIFVISAGAGLFLFSTPLSWLLENYEVPTLYFFIGAVIGGIPLIQKKSGIKRVDINALLYFLIGALIVTLISAPPQNLFENAVAIGGSGWFMLVLTGIASSIALILPGISFSHFLLILGLYEQLLAAVRDLDMTFLIPLAVGVLAGILLFSKILEYVMEKYPKAIYLLILGFIIGSLAQIFPGIPFGVELIVCAATGLSGFFATYRRREYLE